MKKTACLITLVFVALAYPQTKQDIVVDNVAVYRGNDRWEWTIFIKSSPDVLKSIDYVQYTLHSTFADPIQKVYKTSDPDHPFGLTRTGWGVFEVPVRVVFKNGEQQPLRYLLRFQQASQAAKCRASFVVDQRHYVRINDELFKGELYVYVGGIYRNTKKPFYSTVFASNQSLWSNGGALQQSEFDKRMKQIAENQRWSSKLRDIGDAVAFQEAGRPFHLEVVNVTSQSGSRKVTLRVCEY
jgi:transcription initiation factor IIF auxiliary subunit